MLKITHANTGYYNKQVLFDVELNLAEGETILLVGANGEGKSTLLNLVSRRLPLWFEQEKGSCLEFNAEPINQKITSELIQRGLVYIPQKNELFEGFSVKENLIASVALESSRKKVKQHIDDVLIHLPILKELTNQSASHLSGGERKLLSLGMALMNKPKLLLLDEPLSGISTENVSVVLDVIRLFQKMNISLLIVEHRIRELFSLADRIVGMKEGRTHLNKFDNLNAIKEFML